MSSSVHINVKGKLIIILGERATQRFDNMPLKAESKCSIYFEYSRKRFLLSLHDVGSNNVFLLMVQKCINSNQ